MRRLYISFSPIRHYAIIADSDYVAFAADDAVATLRLRSYAITAFVSRRCRRPDCRHGHASHAFAAIAAS